MFIVTQANYNASIALGNMFLFAAVFCSYDIIQEAGIYFFQWQIERIVKSHFTTLGWSINTKFCFGYLFIPGRARSKIDFCPMVHRTWRNRHLVQKNLVGSAEELEWNRRNLAGIGTEPVCLFLHVPNTLAPISLFGLPFLVAKSHLKEGRPWMTFLSRSNEGRRFFQFAIENFKRRSLIQSCTLMYDQKISWI